MGVFTLEAALRLSGLFSLIHNMPSYRDLTEELGRESSEQRAVTPEAAKPYLLACLWQKMDLPMLALTSSADRAKRLFDQLLSWCGSEAPIQLFPEPDALPYERLVGDPANIQERLRGLSILTQESSVPLIVASVRAAAQKTIPPDIFASTSHVLKVGIRVDLEQLLSQWMRMGYQVVKAVEVPGNVSRRGGIIDIYSPNDNLPVRIELFGDEIESLRSFDPTSQRSLNFTDSVTIVPAKEVLTPTPMDASLEEILERLDLSACNSEMREKLAHELALFLAGQPFDGSEFYAPVFHSATILDYLTQKALLVLDEPAELEAASRSLDTQGEELRQSQIQRGELPQNFPVPYLTWAELTVSFSRIHKRLALSRWGAEEGTEPSSYHALDFALAPTYGGRLHTLLREVPSLCKDDHRVIIVSQQAKRLSELLKEENIFVSPLKNVDELTPPGSLTVVQGSLAEGWIMKEGPETLEVQTGLLDSDLATVTLLTDTEIFGFSKQRRIVRRRAMRREEFLSELAAGDHVVHIEHGIARFAGLVNLTLNGVEREYLLLEYAAGDKLYVPIDQADRVTRYIGPGGYVPTLSRLGTQEWARTKQRIRDSIGNIAQELLALYSAREVAPGYAFSPDNLWQQELEDSFPYVETPDQLSAVEEVKQDMEKPRPMDRLILGDVGYGKTEVALRAAFKAVMDNKQVAVLVPTTVLAQQHFTTFSQRLEAFPIRVELLSRFRSEKEQRAVLDGLANGSVDICIGTHRLLQKDIVFKNLGLVIIDEEQRFGVAHKERLKQMRKEVDILTLSATPIPRTLHMSLVGLRDMSTMETPPEERLPIKTYVAEYDERLIREAILRELDRNGQVFFVHNRVQSISYIANRLRKLVPEAEITVAHGQMPEEVLESAMLDFWEGRSDVLVCTTIIEAGLDMPNVNTLIVNEADKLGLAQLYQLRGRVGRGSNRAYAYFLYNKGKRLTLAAQKRLETIFEATELGAGFRIAMKDLEIRGAGNLLGAEQSGHIGAVGFELYTRLLAEAIEKLKGGEGEAGLRRAELALPSPTIDVPLAAYIPADYVSDEGTRLALYQRMAKLASFEEGEELAQELRDRFGELPTPVKSLLYLLKIKMLAIRAGVVSISSEGNQIVVKPEGEINRPILQKALGDKVRIGLSQIRLDKRRLGLRWQETLEQLLETIGS